MDAPMVTIGSIVVAGESTKRRGERGELGGAARRAALLTARDHQSKDELVLAATACTNQVTTRTRAWAQVGSGPTAGDAITVSESSTA